MINADELIKILNDRINDYIEQGRPINTQYREDEPHFGNTYSIKELKKVILIIETLKIENKS